MTSAKIRPHATCASPIMHLICRPEFCITLVFHHSWVLQPSQEKLKTMLMQNLDGGRWQIRCIMGDVQVAYRPYIKEWQFLIMFFFFFLKQILKRWKYDIIRYRSYPLLSIPSYSRTFGVTCVHTKTISRRLWCPKTPFTCRRNARREEKNLIITKIIYSFWPANIFTIAVLHLFFTATP